MSYVFLLLENPSVPFPDHPREVCCSGAGCIRLRPANVTAPESEQPLVPRMAGLRTAPSSVSHKLLEPGSLGQYLRTLPLLPAHMPSPSSVALPPLPLLRHTHTHTAPRTAQPTPSKKHCVEDTSPAERSPERWVVCQAVPELALGVALWGQSTWEPEATLAGPQTPRAPSPWLPRLLPNTGE